MIIMEFGNVKLTVGEQRTKEKMVQRVLQATADVDAGRGLMSLEDFEKRVRSWYN